MACRLPQRFLFLLALVMLAGPTHADDRLTAHFDDDLARVDARLCFDGPAPDRLYRHDRAGEYASPLRRGGRPLTTRVDDNRVELPELPDNACVEWTVDLQRAVETGGYRTAFRSGDAVLAVTSLWLWKGPWRRPLLVRIGLPEGAAFSAPWPRVAEDAAVYRPVQTPSGWYARSAVGFFREARLDVPGGTVALALLGDLDDGQADKLTRWVRRSLDAVTPVFGEFPRPHVQVVVVPTGPGREPVPWAHVLRGGGPAVQFYVDETRSLAEFDADWTATHEFSHLLLPYVSRRDRWLSEGLASYYQNVLRARDGRLSERQAWQKLYEGFQRGVSATRPETLAEAAAGGRGSTMRVYWSGAAMLLQADAALRERSGGAQTLDTALARLRDCCWEDGKLWRARELLATLDRLTRTDVFLEVYRDNVERPAFPDYGPTFDALGLEDKGGRIRIVENASLAGVRAGIMKGDRGDNRPGPGSENAP